MDPNNQALMVYSKRKHQNQVEDDDDDIQITGIHYKPCVCCSSPYSESPDNVKKAKMIMDKALNHCKNMHIQVKEEPEELDEISLRKLFYGAEIGESSSRPMQSDLDEIAVEQEETESENEELNLDSNSSSSSSSSSSSNSDSENEDVDIEEETNPDTQLVLRDNSIDYLGGVRIKEEPQSFPEFIYPPADADIDQENNNFPSYASYIFQQPSDGNYGSYIMHTEPGPGHFNFYPNQPDPSRANFYSNQPGPNGSNNQNPDAGIGTEYFRTQPNTAFDFEPVTNINLFQRFDMLHSQNRITLSYTQTNETYFVPTVNPPYQVDRNSNIEVRVIQDECRIKPSRIVLVYEPTHLVSEEDNASMHVTKMKFLKLVTPRS